jgi:hypothetical protein
MKQYQQEIITALLNDPEAGDYRKAYANTNLPELFNDLIEKDGSILNGIIYVLEIYLDR